MIDTLINPLHQVVDSNQDNALLIFTVAASAAMVVSQYFLNRMNRELNEVRKMLDTIENEMKNLDLD